MWDFELVAQLCQPNAQRAARRELKCTVSMPFRVQLSTRAGKGWPAHRAKIIFLTVHKDADYVTDARGAGGSVYIVKSSPVWCGFNVAVSDLSRISVQPKFVA